MSENLTVGKLRKLLEGLDDSLLILYDSEDRMNNDYMPLNVSELANVTYKEGLPYKVDFTNNNKYRIAGVVMY